MSKVYNIKNFEENGFAAPLYLSKENQSLDFEKDYFDFQKKSLKHFNRKISVKPNLLSVFFDKLTFDKEIIRHVKSLIGNDIYIWSSAIFFKGPSDGKIVSYHQDNPYWQLTTENVVTAWIALTASNEHCGALEIVPGSYKLGLIKKLDISNPRQAYLKGLKTTQEKDLLSYNQNLEDFIKNNKPEIINLKPGQFSLHHINAVHGSGVNESNKNRIGFAIRYISSQTKHKTEAKDSAVHVSGIKSKYFLDELRPTKDFSCEAINAFNKAMESAGAFGNKKY